MVKRSLQLIFLIFVMIFLYGNSSGASKRVLVDEIKVDSTLLVINFHAEGMIDKEIIDRLKNGFTSTLEYKIQLWKKKPLIFNQLVYETTVRRKISFDNWDNKYIVVTEKELRHTSSLEKVRRMCLNIEQFALIPVSEIKKNSDYFITVQLLLKPMSVETLEEMSRWFKRRANPSDAMQKEDLDNSQGDKASSRLLKFFSAFTGLSDKIISSKSVSFRMNDKNEVKWLD
ncbi:MAG: DUF4390 domain-containing protein [Methanosarcinaceae archaeon]